MKHPVRSEKSIVIRGKAVGRSIFVKYEDGPPVFGLCEWEECLETATETTLLGLQFCDAHFMEFYTEEDKPQTQ